MNAEGTFPRKAKAGNVIPFIFQIITSYVVKGEKQKRGEGLCGPRAPAPGDFAPWTSIADIA